MIATILFFAAVLSGIYRSIIPFLIGIAVSLVILSRQVYKLKSTNAGKEYKDIIENLQGKIDILEKSIAGKPGETPQAYAVGRQAAELTAPASEEAEEIIASEEIAAEAEEVLGEQERSATAADRARQTTPAAAGNGEAIDRKKAKEEADAVEEEIIEEQEEVEAEADEEIEMEPPLEKVPGPWDKMQQKFIENWTGILGSIIMVMGVAFLGVYTALKLSPLYRFVMIVLFSVFLFGIFVYLKSKSKWLKLALWLRSSAGAIFLFACAGASGIEGLRWVIDPVTGLMFLSLGILVNLYLGYAVGKQVFASLHVLLSLIALTIAPQTTSILIVATIVSLFGVALTYREKWEYHLLFTISLFFFYHIYWSSQVGFSEISKAQHYIVILAVASVSVLALLVHYRSLYKTREFQALPFFIHFINWFYFGIGLYLHSFGSPSKPIILAAGSLAAFFLARRARRTGIQWLYLTDTLAAQAIALFALYSMSRWGLDPYFIAGMMFLEILLFLVIMLKEGEKFLGTVGTVIKYILGITLISWALSTVEGRLAIPVNRLLATLSICVIFATAFHLYVLKKLAKNISSGSKTGESSLLFPLTFFIYGFYTGVFFSLLSSHWKWKSPAIALIAVIAFVTAKFAKLYRVKALKITGVLVAQAAALSSLFALTVLDVPAYLIAAAMFIETLLFLLLMIKEEEKPLWRTGTTLLIIIGGALIFITLEKVDYGDTAILLNHAITLIACVFFGTLFHIYTLKKFGETFDSYTVTSPKQEGVSYQISTTGFLLAILILSALINTYRMAGSAYIFCVIGIIMLFIRQRFQSNGLGIGLILFIAGCHFYGWNYMSLTNDADVLTKIIYSLSFLLLSFAAVKMSFVNCIKKHLKAFGIYLFYIHLLIAAYYIFYHISPFVTGTVWLFFSLVTLELAHSLRKKYGDKMAVRGDADNFLLHMGYLLIAAFLVRHIFIHLASPEFFVNLPLRLAVIFSALFTFCYWALRKVPDREEGGKIHLYLRPLFLELIFLFSILTICVESEGQWLPLIWIAAALGCLIIGERFAGETSRIRFYSLLFFWASTVYVAIYPPSAKWEIHTAVIFLQFVYIILIHKLKFLQEIKFPKALSFLSPLVDAIEKRKNPWIHYPLFISIALFLYQAFSQSVLTLLWVLECFLVFILSVILKENHFRYLAMTGLGLTLMRLVLYDLAKSDTITRALVFIGVGVMMLIMNSLYNKYKDRF